MRKLFVFLATFFLLFGIAVSAHAYQSAYAYSNVDLNKLSYSGDAYIGGLGIVSANTKLSADSPISTHDVLNSWAEAANSGAWAQGGYNNGVLYSEAKVTAGQEYGTTSVAFSESRAETYSFFVEKGATVTINLSYYLTGDIDSDGGSGSSYAESQAILGAKNLSTPSSDSSVEDFQYVTSEYGEDLYSVDGILTLTLTGGDQGTEYLLFAGTYSLASAQETASAAPVPEPATMFLLGTGMLGLAGMGRKRIFKK